MKKISYSRHYIDSADIKEVVKSLKSDCITQGPKIKEFEYTLCEYTGAKYAVVLSSGTAALHLSMLALEIGKGDEIITSPVTFSATANCALYVRGIPRFVDIDDKTYHMSIEKLKDFLKVPSQRRRIKAVIPVHLMGTIMDVIEVKKLSDRYGIKVIEDAAHALGARYSLNQSSINAIKIGNCYHSDIAILSFHAIKHITTGEGGAVLTNSKEIYEKIIRLRHHGIVKNIRGINDRHLLSYSRQLWFYDIPQIGFNYRITDFQCALGISQLKKLDSAVIIRRKLVDAYRRGLSGIEEIRLPYERRNTYASYHLFVIRVPASKRDRLYNYLRNNDIYTQINYIPVHLFSYYRKKLGYKWGDFPVAERYFQECLSLPLFVGLSKSAQAKVINLTKKFFS